MASGATVGSAIVKLEFDGSEVKASLQGISKDMEKSGKSSGSTFASAWAVAAGNLISKGISKLGGMISSHLGSAMSRVDVLNNFPQVMQAVGYAADESAKSIENISDHLDGLPTTLDGAVSDIQKLAASMGNLAKGTVNATSVGLGLNDMFLAGGKGTEVASAAMEQYNQMLARGKVDQQSWNSMVNAAPGQMNQLAQSLLGANKNQTDLYKAMQSGKISFDQLNAAIVKLDEEGGKGFASFNEQAIAGTQGLQTQIQNISTSFTKILSAGLNGESMAKPVNQFFNRLGALVTSMAPRIVDMAATLIDVLGSNLPDFIIDLAPLVIDSIAEIVSYIGINAGMIVDGLIRVLVSVVNLLIPQIPVFLQSIVDAILGVLYTISDPANLQLMLNAAVELLMTLAQAIPEVLTALANALPDIIASLVSWLTDPSVIQQLLDAAITLFMALVECLPDILVALINALPTIIDGVISFLTNPSTIGQLINAAVKLFTALVIAVPKILGALIGAFGSLVGSLWNNITRMFGEFAGKFGNFIGGIFKGAINGVLGFIEGIINGPIDIINGFIGIINGAFGWVGVNLGTIGRINLPRLAEGGYANGATGAVIGEAGKEVVLPLEQNTDNWAGLLASTLAEQFEGENGVGGVNITIENQNFDIDNDFDATEAGRLFMQEIRRTA